MIRSVLAACLFSFLVIGNASAQSCTVPNTLTNGTNADATQVMANFAAILTCLNNQPPAGVQRSYLAGLTLSTAGSSSAFTVAVGVATSDDATTSMPLAMAYSKTTSPWAAGSSNGSLDTGLIANNTWYHVYLIERVDTSVVDVLISLNPTSPSLMPASYTKKRRIGSMKTNGSAQWTKFSQVGDEFLWDVRVNDVNGAATPASATLTTLSLPTGLQLRAQFTLRVDYSSVAAAVLATSPDESDQAATTQIQTVTASPTATTATSSLIIRTNTNGQVRIRASGAGSFYYITTYGWIDRRGRDL